MNLERFQKIHFDIVTLEKIDYMEAKSLSITKEEFDSNIERTMLELKKERPLIKPDKQQVSYENALHPSRSSSSTIKNTQPLLLDSAKASALLEKGSQFAQKTMQRSLSFVGKIFQGLSDTTSASPSRPGSPQTEDDESEGFDQHSGRYESQQQPYFQQHAPRSPQIDQIIIQQQKQQFDENLKSLVSMFPNIDNSVCHLVLHENGGDLLLSKSIDK